MSAAPALRRASQPMLVEGEFTFTAVDFAVIAGLLRDHSGITLSETKAALVYSRLAKRLRQLGLASFSDYCAIVAGAEGEGERTHMFEALTTNVTRFFREPHHFEHLREKVLAPRVAAMRSGARLRLWSAACSTGQEAYSIALTLLGALPEAAELDVRILATDIDTKVLAQAGEGAYGADQVAAIPADLRARWLERDPGRTGAWRMSAAARSLVVFKPLNLVGRWPLKGPFDAVFCRNVAIYFDEATQETIWSRLAPLLARDGRLYIGHSERVTGPAAARLASDGLTVYRPVEARP